MCNDLSDWTWFSQYLKIYHNLKIRTFRVIKAMYRFSNYVINLQIVMVYLKVLAYCYKSVLDVHYLFVIDVSIWERRLQKQKTVHITMQIGFDPEIKMQQVKKGLHVIAETRLFSSLKMLFKSKIIWNIKILNIKEKKIITTLEILLYMNQCRIKSNWSTLMLSLIFIWKSTVNAVWI